MTIYFKENLMEIRKRKNITQEKLGELCGVSRQAVTKWESGESLPDLYKLDEISDVLGVKIQDLIYKKANYQEEGDELKSDIKNIYKLIKEVNEGKTSSCLIEEYLQLREIDVHEQGQRLLLDGIKAVEMIETDKAYELFEKALVRGVTSAGIELLKLFADWYECEDMPEEKIELEVFIGRLIQEYGKILVEENKRKYGVTGSDYIL